MGDILIYPYKLFDLEVEKVRTIIGNTFEFTFYILEGNIPELIDEIKDHAGVDHISDTTLDQAIDAVDNHMKTINKAFDKKLSSDKWAYVRDRAGTHYLKPFNEDGALIFTNKETVICMPLYLALGETAIAVFDYHLSKSDELKRKLQKSNDPDRKKILKIKSKASLKYYFARVLKKHGVSYRQTIKNMPAYFGTNVNKGIDSTSKLPDLFR